VYSKGGKVRKCTTWEIRAQMHIRKEVGLENTLPERWELKDTLKRKRIKLKAHYLRDEGSKTHLERIEIELESALSKKRWLESARKR